MGYKIEKFETKYGDNMLWCQVEFDREYRITIASEIAEYFRNKVSHLEIYNGIGNVHYKSLVKNRFGDYTMSINYPVQEGNTLYVTIQGKDDQFLDSFAEYAIKQLLTEALDLIMEQTEE